MKLSGELDYRIRYDVEHDLFHAQNVFDDEYITPTFIEYVQNLEKENAELKENNQFLNNLVKEKEQRGLEIQEDLLKENAELKKELEGADNATDCFNKQEEIIAKAKELLKDITSSYGSTEVSEAQLYLKIKKAEQFLNDLEK